ncbi:uroporphyrinogen-III C-methyltransferase [Glaciecola petra]|uniref:Uroporphyrinogen-III C-methyltransferase n=1 Tax=Glaciecola petra TaxID=3075602 RepID=A0ABU2ZUK6_9ALTE|nr:uroporphyrinogen-III C-methyltransferase [Aestuariibacter sp. P117]MDT0596328.1 uroporphyrinogen-III C-methyltransferase [Aestuariibacter sp. P117]
MSKQPPESETEINTKTDNVSDIADSKNDGKLPDDSVTNDVVLENEVEEQTMNDKTSPSDKTETIDLNNQSTKSSRKLLWFFTSINFLTLTLLCIVLYWYYTQVVNTETEEATALIELEQKMIIANDQQQSSIDQLSTQLNSFNNAQTSNNNSLESLLAELQQIANENAENNEIMGKRLAEISGRRPSDWLLAEANYLVNMAGRKIYLEQDLRTAITLLQEADARLVDLDDPSLFPVRAHIASDIQTIRQINPVSTQSLALALNGMQAKVGELPMDELQLPETAPPEDLTLSEDINDWQDNLAKTWHSLVDDFISIKSVESPLEPYLSERQKWLIEQQVKHAISQAQTAVLNEQAELYKASTQTALGLLVNHYDLEDSKVGQFVEALQELQNTDFTKTLPTRLQAQASLKDIIEQRIQNIYNNTLPIVNDEGIAL